MQSFQIQKNDSGQRLDKFLQKLCPSLPTALLYKYIRKKRIKVNRHKPEISYRLLEGDVVDLYISDEFFESKREKPAFLQATPSFTVVYEDENLLLADKPPGVAVHTDIHATSNTLIEQIQHYLYQRGSYRPENELSFAPALCNRLDRGTGGIVIAAKNAAALREMNQLIRQRAIGKHYLCAVIGRPSPAQGTFSGYLRKDGAKNRVTVLREPAPGAKQSQTAYRTLCHENGLSLMEVTLLTGRSHQIRVQFAHAGYPLLGDDKYGDRQCNARHDMHMQALYSYRLSFPALPKDHIFHNLSEQSFTVPSVPFCRFFSQYAGGDTHA